MAIGNPVSTSEIKDLGSAGCNYSPDITSLEINESPNSINIEFDEEVVRKRSGYWEITTATGTNDRGYASINFGADSGIQKLVTHQGNTVYSMDDLAGAQTARRTGVPRTNSFFIEIARYLIHTFNDNSTEYYWDGATSTMATLSGSAPGFKHAIESQGFLLGGNTSAQPLRIYYEDTNTMIGGTYADYFTLSGGRDDELTGFFTLNGRSYGTTKTAIFRLSFVGGVTVFEYKKVIDTTGAVPRTAMTVVTEEIGEVVVFLGYDLNVYVFDGSVVRVISDKYRHANNDTQIAMDLLDRSRVENSHAIYDPIHRLYRLFVTKLGDDTNKFCINIDVRTLGYYPYNNMIFHSATVAEDAIGRKFLVATDYVGKVHKLFIDVNSDNGVVIVESYEASPVASNLDKYKKIQTVDLTFMPVGNHEVTYNDRTDFDINWHARDSIPMFINRDRFLGQNTVLGQTAKLASEATNLHRLVNVPVTNNIYRFKLETGGVCNEVCKYTTGTLAGSGGGTAVAGTDTVWTADMTAANGWKIWINDGAHKNYVYDFTYVSATSATVSTMTGASPADDFTGASYEIYRTGYAPCAKGWELLKIDYVVKAIASGKGSKIR